MEEDNNTLFKKIFVNFGFVYCPKVYKFMQWNSQYLIYFHIMFEIKVNVNFISSLNMICFSWNRLMNGSYKNKLLQSIAFSNKLESILINESLGCFGWLNMSFPVEILNCNYPTDHLIDLCIKRFSTNEIFKILGCDIILKI